MPKARTLSSLSDGSAFDSIPAGSTLAITPKLRWFFEDLDRSFRQKDREEPNQMVNIIKGIVRHPRYYDLDEEVRRRFETDVFSFFRDEYPKPGNYRLRLLWRKLYRRGAVPTAGGRPDAGAR